jgi:riboflavin synthase
MFTGLVEAVGTVEEVTRTEGGLRLRIAASFASDLAAGDSVAVNGVCLTAIERGGGMMLAEVGPETLRVTALGDLRQGALVNLERPLRADGRFGGHFVLGHVDGVGQIESLRAEGDFHWLRVGFPRDLAPLFISKGSVAVDGVSLTVASLGISDFDVQLVPFTMTHTRLRDGRAGDRVNLECDMVGKYVMRAAALAGVPLPIEREPLRTGSRS